MAERPAFYVRQGKADSRLYSFEWFPGFSVSQKQKSVKSLHRAILAADREARPLEVSTKSREPIGEMLSAFRLRLNGHTLENVFQSAKVFEKGGPYPDLLEVPPKEAKRDERLRNSGPLTGFRFQDRDFPLIPRYAVLDPKATLSLPPFITATTGLDALTHAVEAYIGRSTMPDTRRDAKKAVRLIFENLDAAYTDGQNIEARKNMLKASFYAGCAFTKSYVGYVHAVAHSLGGEYNVPHGLANAVLLPTVLEHYGPAVYKKLHKLAIEAHLADEKTPSKEAAETFIQAIRDMKQRFGIGDTIPEIREEDIPKLTHYADKEANPLYPVPVLMNAAELEVFYRSLMEPSASS